MRRELHPHTEARRLTDGTLASEPGSGPMGAFSIPGPLGLTLDVIASDGRDWQECGLPGDPWEHVSVSTPRRTPTWREMEYVRDLFFEPTETVLQFSVPREKHVNLHDHVLHMWRPTGVDIALPPVATV